MKKILLIIFPSISISLLIYISRYMLPETSQYILVWMYLVFPLIFLVQGIACSNSPKSMTVGLLLSAISVMIPISMWYRMNGIIIPVIIYLLLGVIGAYLKNVLSR